MGLSQPEYTVINVIVRVVTHIKWPNHTEAVTNFDAVSPKH